MLTVFFVATFNIALGFFVAYLLDERSIFRRAQRDNEGGSEEVVGKNVAKIIPVETKAAKPLIAFDQKQEQPSLDSLIPTRWLETLGDVINRIETVREAAAVVASKQIESVTKKVSGIDERLKNCGNNIGEWSNILAESQRFFSGWCETNRQFIEELRSDCEAIDHGEIYWNELDRIVQEHISSTEKLLREVDDAGAQADQEKLLSSTRNFIPMICEFRDQVNIKIAANYYGEHAVEIRDRSLRIDEASGVFSRAALASIFEQWWQDDPQRDRVASVALIDICNSSSINQRFGFEVSNQIIASFIEGVQGCTRQNRGYDRVARFSGQQIFVFLGDTSLTNTIKTVNRFMATMLQTEFHVGDEVLHLSQNSVVTRLFKEDTVDKTVARLVDAMPLAKQNGPNALAVNEDSPRLASTDERAATGAAPVAVA